MKLSDLPVFYLDLQTTGSRPIDSDILEIAWGVADKEQGLVNSESVLVLPSTGFVPRRIQMITGISDDDMANALTLPKAFEKFTEFLQGLPANPFAVIHFAQFEKPFLLHAFQLFQKEIPFEMLCTHQIAKRLMPNLPTRGIKGLAGYFGYNSGDLKRSSSHVEATGFIWRGLVDALQEKNIHTREDLRAWLEETPAAKRKKYEYPLPKEKRLSLPHQPGVYRMLSRWGEVLYVGKATSLHSRVNSYFRGQKNRDPRKLEMLTQTWDLHVTPVGSPLEAALLETDEIKRLNPRYNISLKTGHRAFVFFNRDFTSMSFQQDAAHSVGPFSNPMVMDSMLNLADSLRKGRFSPTMFFDPIDPEVLEKGFLVFCDRHGFQPDAFRSLRSILAVGLRWHREDVRMSKLLQDEDRFFVALENKTADFVESRKQAADNDEEVEMETEPAETLEEILKEELPETDTDEDVLLTPEDVADKFERHFLRAARAYARAQQLTRLLNADIDFTLSADGPASRLVLRRGQLESSPLFTETMQKLKALDEPASSETDACKAEWRGLSIDTYDRMSILVSELAKIKSRSGTVLITNCSQKANS